MSDDMVPARGRLREHVAEEIRVLLARKKMSGAELARRTGVKQSSMSRRMTGETAFDMDDLEAIAHVLDINLADLIRKADEGAKGDFDHAPAERAATIGHPFVGLTEGGSRPAVDRAPTRPFGHPKPGPKRPGSPVPAAKRRPARITPPSR